MSMHVMCDTKFCDHVATWTGPDEDGMDVFACDEHVPRGHHQWRRMEGAAEMARIDEDVVAVATTLADDDLNLWERIERSMTNHSPDREQVERIEALREDAKALARTIISYCVSSRERSLALTNLEDALMWAVKSIVLEP